MPRKKKEKTTAASKPIRKSKSPVKAKEVKKVSKTSSAAKKKSVQPQMKKQKTTAAAPGSPRLSKTVKKQKSNLNSADPVITSSFKPMARQGETQLVAFVRDPQCVFTYWEVTPERLELVKRELKGEFKDSYMVLRLFHIGFNGERILFDEIRIEPEQINSYVELKQAGGTYILEIARKTQSGRVITYVQSNIVSTTSQLYLDLGKTKARSDVWLEEMPQELQDYYLAQGYDPDDLTLSATEKISSAENLKRLKNINRSSFF